ncbi:hypothetical protein MNEG_7309 [Monoraphidium neglectum]|uniref:Uncharacterized protein n=1 Tax=Monoraphidium neglectum TaxID=145388 RepID=A0A0D2KZT1_9CHLO|nr:hypothetical protein MNEG_7309 [Monoraphidium neglectum]KIZ00654.1 hypothetical protein MNEG_7309 [Monoraphidium neglectum]|eukprot:XP_013899673.1 hypothetical protein MNEG_7309 [Monoraphidium neglectum]
MLGVLSSASKADGSEDSVAAAAAAAAAAERIAEDEALMQVVRRHLAGSQVFEPALRLVKALLSHLSRRCPREAAVAALGDGSRVLLGGNGVRLDDPRLNDRLYVLALLVAACGDEQRAAVAAVIAEHGIVTLLLKALSHQDFAVRANTAALLVVLCSFPISCAAVSAHPAALAALSSLLRAAGAVAGKMDADEARELDVLATDALQAICFLMAPSAAAGDAFAAMALAPTGYGILDAVERLLTTPAAGDPADVSARRYLRGLAAAATALSAITRAAAERGRLAALQTRGPLVVAAGKALVWVADGLRGDGRPREGGELAERDERWMLQAAEKLLEALHDLTDATADGSAAAAALEALGDCGPEAMGIFGEAAVYASGAVIAALPNDGDACSAAVVQSGALHV